VIIIIMPHMPVVWCKNFWLRNTQKLGKDIIKRKVSHHTLWGLGGFLLSAIVKIQLEKSKKGGC